MAEPASPLPEGYARAPVTEAILHWSSRHSTRHAYLALIRPGSKDLKPLKDVIRTDRATCLEAMVKNSLQNPQSCC